MFILDTDNDKFRDCILDVLVEFWNGKSSAFVELSFNIFAP